MLPLSVMLVTGLQAVFFEQQIVLQGIVLEVVSTSLWLAFFTAASFAVFAIGNGVAEAIIAAPHIKDKGIDANMIRIITRTLSFLMTFYIIVAGGQFLGIPLTPLLAGIGVGGFAVALAARPTLENFIGGMTLFADKPVRVGDYCRFGETLGTVEEIGFRSTRIRTRGRTIISIPNSKFSELQLENYARRDHVWLYAVLGLRYETTPEQLRYVLAKVNEMLVAHPKTVKHLPLRVRFIGFNDYSLDLEVWTYVNTRDWDAFLAIREDVYLRIMDIVEQAGTGFAFPSQTTYLARDHKPDAKRVEAAETEVQQWRNEGQLPFPDMPKKRRHQLQDTLNFPPAGSPQGPPLRPRAVANPPAGEDSMDKK
jgi:MscS family membrane protein